MKLRIVGFGIRGVQQLTLEGLDALRRARFVAHLAVAADDLQRLLLWIDVKDALAIDSLYVDGDLDRNNYARMYRSIVEAVASHGDVALLMYGHPRLGVTLTQQLDRLREDGVDVEVIPAPSSFDTLINDLHRDPLERGSVLLDVNRLLLLGVALDPQLDHYLFHVGSVGTARTHVTDPARDNRIGLLKSYLLRFYPREHEAMLLMSPTGGDPEPHRIAVRLSELESVLAEMPFGSTLFVPGVKPKKLNVSFYRSLVATGAKPS